MHLFAMCVPGACRGQKRASDLLKLDGCELPFGCWELNSRPVREHQLLLTAEQVFNPGANFKLNIIED